jgi:hypothetical protein
MGADNVENARFALERVCSGGELHSASCYYSASFADHVNDMEFRGLEGVEQSVGFYRTLLKDVSIEVQEQIADGQHVCSRYVVSGRYAGRKVRFNGMTLSRFENGLIVEDWSVLDTLGLLRQLGVARSLTLAVRAMASSPAIAQGALARIKGACRQKWCAWTARRSRSAVRAR